MQIARGIEGVREVRDRLEIEPVGPGAQDARSGARGERRPGPAGGAVSAGDRDEMLVRKVREAIRDNWTGGRLRLEGDTPTGPGDTRIDVFVDDGIATVEGKVADIQDAVAVAQAARSVQGIRAVRTNIESGPPS